MQNGVEIAHEYQRNLYLVFDSGQLGKEGLEVHAVLEGLSSGTLDDRTIGQRIAERNTNFNHGDAATLHGKNHVGSAFECRTACAEIERQELTVLAVCEKLIDLVCHIL